MHAGGQQLDSVVLMVQRDSREHPTSLDAFDNGGLLATSTGTSVLHKDAIEGEVYGHLNNSTLLDTLREVGAITIMSHGSLERGKPQGRMSLAVQQGKVIILPRGKTQESQPKEKNDTLLPVPKHGPSASPEETCGGWRNRESRGDSISHPHLSQTAQGENSGNETGNCTCCVAEEKKWSGPCGCGCPAHRCQEQRQTVLELLQHSVALDHPRDER